MITGKEFKKRTVYSQQYEQSNLAAKRRNDARLVEMPWYAKGYVPKSKEQVPTAQGNAHPYIWP